MPKAPKVRLPRTPIDSISAPDFETRQAFLHKFPKYRQLESRLLAGGGEIVVLCYEPNLTKEVKKGQIFALPVRRACGGRNACHKNSALFWKKNPARYKIVVGWGLGFILSKNGQSVESDQKWRQHTFILDTKNNVIIETTIPRLKYFGTVLTPKQAELFYERGP